MDQISMITLYFLMTQVYSKTWVLSKMSEINITGHKKNQDLRVHNPKNIFAGLMLLG